MASDSSVLLFVDAAVVNLDILEAIRTCLGVISHDFLISGPLRRLPRLALLFKIVEGYPLCAPGMRKNCIVRFVSVCELIQYELGGMQEPHY
jgi:hypothetical protein